MTFELKLPILTRLQREALFRLYCRDTSVAKSYIAFRRRIMYSLCGEYIVVNWNGLYLGIEQDGYTHS